MFSPLLPETHGVVVVARLRFRQVGGRPIRHGEGGRPAHHDRIFAFFFTLFGGIWNSEFVDNRKNSFGNLGLSQEMYLTFDKIYG
jgi:hypothetical protein